MTASVCCGKEKSKATEGADCSKSEVWPRKSETKTRDDRPPSGRTRAGGLVKSVRTYSILNVWKE